MKLIIDELEAELDDIKSGNRNIDYINNLKGNGNGNGNSNNNTGVNTNRLKQLSVSLNNTSLINHLKKENERLRKLVVTYEFKTKRYNEEKKNKVKKNLININNHFYFSIINTSTPVNTNTDTNSNSMILISNNKELSPNSKEINKKSNKINNNNININNKDKIKETSKNKSVIEKRLKTNIKETKINKIIKDYHFVNSNKNINCNIYGNKKPNIYTKVMNKNKKKKDILIKKINIEKERTSSLIKRPKNTTCNNISTHYNNFTNSVIKSKNVFPLNSNKSTVNYNFNNQKKETSRDSRNVSGGHNKHHFNKSFNESIINKKLLFPMINRNKHINKNNIDKNSSYHSSLIKTERSKKSSQDNSLNISSNFEMFKKYMNDKSAKSGQKDFNKNILITNDLYGNINKDYYNTINDNYKNFKVNILNNNFYRKHSNKKYKNKKYEITNNSVI